jgi:WD40 repeat protein
MGPQTHPFAEIYDPQSGIFIVTDSLNEHRSSHTATLLPDGKVLIVGGLQTTTPGNAKILSTCEVYDPGTGSFALTQSLSYGRSSHTATLIDNEKVLVAGGLWSTSTCELYDPVSQGWTATGPMTVMRRSYHTATLLLDGRVLLTGGYVESVTSTVEIYNPITNTFSPADSMTTVRSEHGASLLPDGNVLVTGGYDGSTAVKSAELLVPPSATAADREEFAESIFLAQNYPNPFNPSTTIRYGLPSRSHVTLTVFNALGQQVATLVEGEQEAGFHEAVFDASGLASGVYLYRLTAGSFVDTRKLILVR